MVFCYFCNFQKRLCDRKETAEPYLIKLNVGGRDMHFPTCKDHSSVTDYRLTMSEATKIASTYPKESAMKGIEITAREFEEETGSSTATGEPFVVQIRTKRFEED